MNLSQTRLLKSKLEQAIDGLLEKFCEDTGCEIDEIYLKTIDVSTKSKKMYLYNIELRVRI